MSSKHFLDLGLDLGSPEEELPEDVLSGSEAASNIEEEDIQKVAAESVDEIDFSDLDIKGDDGTWIDYDVEIGRKDGEPIILELELQVTPLSSREAQTYYATLLQRWLESRKDWASLVERHPKGLAALPMEVFTRVQFKTVAHKCLRAWRGRKTKGPGLRGFPSDVKENRERFLTEFPGAYTAVLNAARAGSSFVELRASDALGNSSGGSNGKPANSEPPIASEEADA